MLENYKRGIQKVALMLQDQKRTRFVVVCIAEYLSVSETQRLLQELQKNRVRASHIIVNQLVVESALGKEELAELEGLAEVGSLVLDPGLLAKTVQACRLTTARKGIQEKYLGQLKAFPETQTLADGICEVPLLSEEVTGAAALRRFAEHLVRDPPTGAEGEARPAGAGPARLYDDELDAGAVCGGDEEAAAGGAAAAWHPTKGDAVRVRGLAKAAQYNGLEGVVAGALDPDTQRCGVRLDYHGKSKTLALQRKHMVLLHRAKKSKGADGAARGAPIPAAVAAEPMSKARALLEDPEIKALVDGNPRFKEAVEDCLANPASFLKYISDPELAPLISMAMSKLQF